MPSIAWAILMTTYAHLARFAHYVRDIPGTQDEAARVMDDILTPIPIIMLKLREFSQSPQQFWAKMSSK
jgi:hypothetical protein